MLPMLVVPAFARVGPPIAMPRRVFDQLAEYSSTTPTGAKPGRVWKRDARFFSRREFAFLHPFDGTPEPAGCGSEWWLARVLDEPHPDGGHWIEGRPIVIRDAGGTA